MGIGLSETGIHTAPTYVDVTGAGDNYFVAVSAGGSHSLALTYGALVYGWGDNTSGQAGAGENVGVTEPILLDERYNIIKTIVAISAGYDHSMALGGDGDLYTWGSNLQGQTGLGLLETEDIIWTPTINMAYLHDTDTIIRTIDAGRTYSTMSDTEGQIYGAGNYARISLEQNDTLGDTPIIVGEKGQPTSKHVITVRVNGTADAEYMLSQRFNLFKDFIRKGDPTLRSVNSDIAEPVAPTIQIHPENNYKAVSYTHLTLPTIVGV